MDDVDETTLGRRLGMAAIGAVEGFLWGITGMSVAWLLGAWLAVLIVPFGAMVGLVYGAVTASQPLRRRGIRIGVALAIAAGSYGVLIAVVGA